MPSGLINTFVDQYWGGAEIMYAQANGTIRMGGLCVDTPVISGNAVLHQMTEVPNTANLGQSIYVAMTSFTAGQYGWFMVCGVAPVNCNASVAANTSLGIAAAGQGGAQTASKQLLGARVAIAASQTVAKSNCFANNGSVTLFVPNSDGWFIGAYLSGTGIAAATVVSDIDPSGNVVTLSAATTGQVNGTVTATYNNGTVFFNVVQLNSPIAQGAIT
jgi:hypothetical protein